MQFKDYLHFSFIVTWILGRILESRFHNIVHWCQVIDCAQLTLPLSDQWMFWRHSEAAKVGASLILMTDSSCSASNPKLIIECTYVLSVTPLVQFWTAEQGQRHAHGGPDVVWHRCLLSLWTTTLLLQVEGHQEVFNSLPGIQQLLEHNSCVIDTTWYNKHQLLGAE